MVDEQKLRQLAEAATQGIWVAGGASVTADETEDSPGLDAKLYGGNGQQKARNSRYIAAANPAAIESLLDELQTLREERTAWRVTAENAEAAVKQARIDALEEAKQACINLFDLRDTEASRMYAAKCADAIEHRKGII